MSVLSLAPLPTIVFLSIATVFVVGCDASTRIGGDDIESHD